MSYTPDTILLRCQLSGVAQADVFTFVARVLADTGVTVTGWAVPHRETTRRDGLDAWFARLATGAEHTGTEGARFELADDGGGVIGSAGDPTSWRLRLHRPAEDLDADERRALLEWFAGVCRAIARSGMTAHGYVEWNAGADCGIELPIASQRAQIVITDEAAVADAYDDPAAFWAAWDDVEEIGALRIATRAMKAATSRELLARTIADQWAMARAAKPGLCNYYIPEIEDGEEDIYRQGERRMNVVGYDPAAQMVELACVLGPGEHISGWEIIDLWYVIDSGQLDDDRPLSEVRVVFADRAAAEAEKRVLLDIGARVFYPGDDGLDAELV